MTMKNLGRMCKAYRRQEGFTQTDVAKDLHITQATVSKFEQGRDDSASILLWYLNKGMCLIGGIN